MGRMLTEDGMLKRIKAAWRLWRLEPGLRAAAELAAERAWSRPNNQHFENGPELNLINLANDLLGECSRLRLIIRR